MPASRKATFALAALALAALMLAVSRPSFGDGDGDRKAHGRNVVVYSKDGVVVTVGQAVTLDQIDASAWRRLRIVVQSRSADSTATSGFVNLYTVADNVASPIGGVATSACAASPKTSVNATAIVDFPGPSVIVQAGATAPGGAAGQAVVDVRIVGSD